MTQFYYYRSAWGATNTFDAGLGAAVIRMGEVPGWQEMAEHLNAGSCQIVLDDPDANVGHAGDAILGNQRIVVKETACSAQITYSGVIGAREYARGDSSRASLRTGASRQITVELHDINALASARVIPQSDRTAIRPHETVDARMDWLMGTSYMHLVSDNGLVASAGTKTCSKSDYRGQRAVNVINDCELAAGFGWNAFIYHDDATNQAALFFDNANTSTAFTSTLKLSNDLSDVDEFTAAGALTFAPFDAVLRRDPTDLGDSVYLPYENGAVFRTLTATQATYGQKDLIAPNANVKSRDKAREIADGFLFQHRTEEDRITCTVELPPSKVNLLRAGMRVLAKFTHLPGYEGWTWFRVVMRAPGNVKATDDRYTVALELSPQEGGCSDTPTFVQTKYHDGYNSYATPNFTQTFPFTAATTPGNLVIVAVKNSYGTGPGNVLAAPSGWNWPIQNVDTDDAGNVSRNNVFWKKSAGESSIAVQWESNNGGADQRWVMAEYAGLTNPTLYDSDTNQEDPTPGYASVPAVSYPSGPSAVITVCFMGDGPTGSDSLSVTGTGHTLRTAISGGLHGSSEAAIGDILKNTATTSGTTPLYPAAGGLRYLFTGGFATLTVGLVFQGDNCG